MTTGEKLQKLRKDNGLTQEDLAATLGVSRQSISKWEGDIAFPETEKLILLAKLYHCTIDYLLNVDNEDAPASPAVKQSSKIVARLPLVLPTVILTIFGVIFFALPCADTWIKVCSLGQCTSYHANFSYFELAFYRVTINNNSWANFLSLSSFLAMLVATGFSITYLFAPLKGFKTVIWIANIVAPLLILASTLSCPVNWHAFPFIVLILQAALAICRFAIKPIRKA